MSEIHLIITELLDGTIKRFQTGSELFLSVVEHYLNDMDIDYIRTCELIESDLIYSITLD